MGVANYSNLLNKRFGRLVVAGWDWYPKYERTMLECICDCGNTKLVAKKDLVREGPRAVRSCGCYAKEVTSRSKFIDLSGSTVGNLEVIERVYSERYLDQVVFKCVCSLCGRECEIPSKSLRNGLVTDCGCTQSKTNFRMDLTGLEIHGMTVIRPSFFRNHRQYWEVKCHCGNIFDALGKDLTREDGRARKSCGCSRIKHGMSGSRIYRIWYHMRNRCNNGDVDVDGGILLERSYIRTRLRFF